jgi:hypothetical protein
MTPKERLMAVLSNEQNYDRIPWSPLISGYYLASLREERSELDAFRDVGADAMIRKIPVWRQSVFHPYELPKRSTVHIPLMDPPEGVRCDNKIEGDTILRTYYTPLGSISEKWRLTETSPFIPFPEEYLIKRLEDIKIYRYLVEKEQFIPHYEDFERLSEIVGDDGIVTTFVPHTPIQHLLIVHIGIEKFYYMLVDHREEMIDLMNLMHGRNKEVCDIIAQSPAKVAIEYENTGTTYVSPQIYEEFEMPAIDDYADKLHAAGKIFLIHMCGRLKGLAELIRLGRHDGSIDVATFPTGDWTLSDAMLAWPEKIIGGGLDAILLANGTTAEVKRHAQEVIQSIAPGDLIILGTGDAVAFGTPLENLQAVTEIVEAYGSYPITI